MSEEYYSVPKDPAYSAEDIRKIRNEDPVNAERIVNPVIERLIQNTHAVKMQADAAGQKLGQMESAVGGVLAGKADLDGKTGKLQAGQLPSHAATHASGGGDPITPASIGAVPAARKINGKALGEDISLAAADVGAAETDHSHSAAEIVVPDVTAAALGLTSVDPTVDQALGKLAALRSAFGPAIDNIYSSLTPRFSVIAQTYTGTGTYGADNPKIFATAGKPLALFISGGEQSARYYTVRAFRGNTDALTGTSYGGVVSWADRAVTWYHSSGAANQCNEADVEYTAILICETGEVGKRVSITVKTSDNLPVDGATVDGVYTLYGVPVVTDTSGKAEGYARTGDQVTISANYIDLQPLTFMMPDVPEEGMVLTKTIPYVAAGTIVEITRSQEVQTFKTRNVAVSVVGGGTGGQGGKHGSVRKADNIGGAGGEGGKILNGSVTLTGKKAYSAVIGAGGIAGGGGTESASPSVGLAGGDTTFAGLDSTSGSPSTIALSDSSLKVGGKGGTGGAGGRYSNGTADDQNYSYPAGAGTDGERGGGHGGAGGTANNLGSNYGNNGNPGSLGGGGGGGGNGGNAWVQYEFHRSSGGGVGGRGGNGVVLIKF